ncbi:MAG: hypothetical protein ACOZAO_05100 [Patescibacteria group bacterium]
MSEADEINSLIDSEPARNLTLIEEALQNPESEIVVDSIETVPQFVSAIFEHELQERFGSAEVAEDGHIPYTEQHLPFHGVEHSRYVAEKSVSLMLNLFEQFPQLARHGMPQEFLDSASQTDVENYRLVLMYAYGFGHDIEQNFDYNEVSGFRTRHRGAFESDIQENQVLQNLNVAKGNEQLSAEYIYSHLQRYVTTDGEKIFNNLTLETVQEDIAATFPHVYFKQFKGEFRKSLVAEQPYLEASSSLEAFLLAMVDLRENIGNSTDYDEYERASLAEFRELRISIGHDVESGIENISPDRREEIASAILDWMSVADSFIAAQRNESEKVINELFPAENPEYTEVNAALHEHFNARNFSTNIEEAHKRYVAAESTYGCVDCTHQIAELLTRKQTLLESQESLDGTSSAYEVDDELESIDNSLALARIQRVNIIKEKMSDDDNFRQLLVKSGYSVAYSTL